MGDSRFARCLQGGGVYVDGVYGDGGTVTISLCTISGNRAILVRADFRNFTSPRWENCLRACLNSRLHNCERFGQLQGVRATETLKVSPSPQWETHVLLVVRRAVVSQSGLAQ